MKNQEQILDLIDEVLDEPDTTFPDAEIMKLAEEAVMAITNPKPETGSMIHLLVSVSESLAAIQEQASQPKTAEDFSRIKYQACDTYKVPQQKLKSAEHVRGRRY